MNVQSTWGLAQLQGIGYRMHLEDIRAKMKVGDWYKETYWVNTNLAKGYDVDPGWKVRYLKVIGIYSHYALFENDKGRRESFKYQYIDKYMEKVENQELLNG